MRGSRSGREFGGERGNRWKLKVGEDRDLRRGNVNVLGNNPHKKQAGMLLGNPILSDSTTIILFIVQEKEEGKAP